MKEKEAISKKVKFLAEELLYDEDVFYQILLDNGITVDVMRQIMGDEAARHMQCFCEEHGLI